MEYVQLTVAVDGTQQAEVVVKHPMAPADVVHEHAATQAAAALARLVGRDFRLAVPQGRQYTVRITTAVLHTTDEG